MTQGRRSLPEALGHAPTNPLGDALPTTAELLANGYQRWFDPLHAYVSRHIPSRQVRERIVREVLSENLDLLVGRREEALEICRLKATANRLIAEVLTGEDLVRTHLYGRNERVEHVHVPVPTSQPRPR